VNTGKDNNTSKKCGEPWRAGESVESRSRVLEFEFEEEESLRYPNVSICLKQETYKKRPVHVGEG